MIGTHGLAFQLGIQGHLVYDLFPRFEFLTQLIREVLNLEVVHLQPETLVFLSNEEIVDLRFLIGLLRLLS